MKRAEPRALALQDLQPEVLSQLPTSPHEHCRNTVTIGGHADATIFTTFAGKDEMKESVRMSIPFTEITQRSGAKRDIPSLDACMLVLPFACSCCCCVGICCCSVGICMWDHAPPTRGFSSSCTTNPRISGENSGSTQNCECTFVPHAKGENDSPC